MVRSEIDFAVSVALPSKRAFYDASHVIIECLHFNPPRAPLKRFFQFNSLEFDLISVSGQNPTIPVHLPFKIRNQFAKFLSNADILKMI